MRYWVGLGSNQGDSAALVRQALHLLDAEPAIALLRASPLYLSEPWGVRSQPPFVNAVAELQSELAPLELLDRLQAVEARLGRTREGQRWGPRTMDIDLLLAEDEILILPRLVVPHPRMHRRRFVLEPLAAMEASLVIPGRGGVTHLIGQLSDPEIRQIDGANAL